MTVIPFLIIGLLVGASASTLPTDLVCDTNPLRVHRSPKYLPEVTQITDDFYQIGWSVVHASNGETTIPYEIILLKSANTYKVHAIGSDLSVYNQTYTSTNPTQLLQVLQHIIFVKEFSAGSQTFKYAAYLFDTSDVTSSALRRIQINLLTYPAGSKQDGLQFNKLLQYNQLTQTLYVLMTNNGYSEIQSKSLQADGSFENTLPIADTRVNIKIGNHQLIFDQSVRMFYRLISVGNSYQQLEITTSDDDPKFGPVLTQNFQYFKLFRGTFAITSHSGNPGSISSSFAIFSMANVFASGKDLEGTGTFEPVIHYNKYNFIFISENLFSFSRYNSALVFSKKQFNPQSSGQSLEAKEDFKSALRVSFNIDKQFILTENRIIIYEITHSQLGDQIISLQKLAVFQLGPDVADLIKEDSNQWIRLRIKCSCARILVTKLKCFSNQFKCLAINSYIPDDCTIPYNDVVPEIA